jgi:hypothetical protein
LASIATIVATVAVDVGATVGLSELGAINSQLSL